MYILNKICTTYDMTEASREHGPVLLMIFSSDVSALHSCKAQDEAQHSDPHAGHQQSPYNLNVI